ncbi:MAG: 16S rRNA processing protein RimM [Alphaproteobacteria bacterium]|nr:16S rRNA processing protein RimM [Alphaproteobacteria bacterium]
MADNSKKILVGKIVAPQGIRGEVRVQTFTQSPQDMKTLQIVSDKFADGAFRFIRTIPSSNVIIAKIDKIDDRNAAEALRGTELFVVRDTLPQLSADDEYYQADLIGFNVVRDGSTIGTVACFQNFGAGDIIELDNGQMVSFVGATVDAENRIIVTR